MAPPPTPTRQPPHKPSLGRLRSHRKIISGANDNISENIFDSFPYSYLKKGKFSICLQYPYNSKEFSSKVIIYVPNLSNNSIKWWRSRRSFCKWDESTWNFSKNWLQFVREWNIRNIWRIALLDQKPMLKICPL